MLLVLLSLSIGLGLLFFGGDWLVKGASRLAESLGISPLIVGLTVVAMGTSAPELLVSVSAAMRGASDIAIGNVIGSNIANIGVILGLSGLIFPIAVHVNLLKREIPIMIGVAILTTILIQDSFVGRTDGILLLGGMVIFLGFIIWSARREQSKTYDIPEEKTDEMAEPVHRRREGIRVLFGIILLMAGAQLTVDSATEIARDFGVSELVIGVTLVAVGTSLPELVTSVTAARRREGDIAIGNVVGSNIFNILGILGMTALIQPIPVAQQTVRFDSLIMVGLSLLLLPFVLDRNVGRVEAVLFLLLYVAFVGYTIWVGS